MPAFPDEIKTTGSYNYLRKEARDRNLNPCFDHVSMNTVLSMNEIGTEGVLHCLLPIGTQCPCRGLSYILETEEECWAGVFRRFK